MARREVLLEVGMFDARFGLYEDWNLWTRIARRYDIAYVHEPLVNYRVHIGPSGSVFQTSSTEDIDHYRRMHLDQVLNDPELRDVFAGVRREAYARHHIVVGKRACESGQPWYARREALKAALTHPAAILGAAKVLARTFAPGPLVDWVRRRRETQTHSTARKATAQGASE